MKKNDKSILIAILGGIVTCFVCIGMVFAFSSNKTSNLRGNVQESPTEIQLGALSDSCNNTYCAQGTKTGVTCLVDDGIAEAPDYYCPGGYEQDGHCYHTDSSLLRCSSCAEGSYLDNYDCKPCPNGQYCAGGTAQPQNTPTPTPVYTSVGNCSNSMTLNSYESCAIPSGKKCKVYGMGSYQTSGTISTTTSVTIDCADNASTSSGVCCCTKDKSMCSWLSICTSSQPSSVSGATEANCKNNEVTPTPTPTPTPAYTSVGNCSNSMTLNSYESCTIPSGKKCKVYGMGSYQTSGTISTTTSVTIDCANASTSSGVCCCTKDKSMCSWLTTCTSSQPSSVSGATEANCKNNEVTPTPTPTTCKSGEYLLVRNGVDVTNECVKCNNPAEYKDTNGKYCVTCPDAYRSDGGRCYIDIPAGGYLVGGTNRVALCPSNTYSEGGRHYLTGSDDVNVVGEESCKKCPTDKPYSPLGSKSVGECYSGDKNKCTLSVTTSAKIVSAASDRELYDQRPYADTFTVKVTGSGPACNNTKIKLTTDGKSTRTAVNDNMLPFSDGATLNVTFKATVDLCTTTTVTATAYDKNNNKVASNNVSVEIRKVWSVYKPLYCTTEADYNQYYHSYAEADDNTGGKNPNYYAIAVNNDCGSAGTRKIIVYHRGCGTGGQSTPTPSTTTTPIITPVPTPKIEACYITGSGEYVWTSNPQTDWLKVTGITSEIDCKKDENDACYQDPSGNYVWGKYAKKDGYRLIPSMTTKDSCKKEQPGEACYKNADNKYLWTTTPPAGYVKVPEAKTPAECVPEEEPACYFHGDDFVWGKYANVKGYSPAVITIIVDGKEVDVLIPKDECKKPDVYACYKDPSGNYVWGQYGTDPKYELVPDKTSQSECVNEIPVPKTASNVSKLVYVFMAILMACGISFIYYSSVIKKKNQ